MKTLGMILTAAFALVAGAQTLTFEKTLFDFGDLTGADTVSTTIKYSNTGDRELVIKNVRTTCGCTAGVPAKTILAPGEESTVEVSFVAKGKRGKQRKRITFTSNDPKQRVQNIYITANITTLWAFIPPTVDFYISDGTYENSRDTFAVENRSNETLTVLSIEPRNARFSVLEAHRVKREVEPGSSTTYTIAVDPTYRPKRRLNYSRVTVHAKIGDAMKIRTLGAYIRNKGKTSIQALKPKTANPEPSSEITPSPGTPEKIEPENGDKN
jgi:hypothetical protein